MFFFFLFLHWFFMFFHVFLILFSVLFFIFIFDGKRSPKWPPKLIKKATFFQKKGPIWIYKFVQLRFFFFLFFNIDFFDFFGPLLAPFWPRLGPLGSIWAPRGVILEPRGPFWRPFLMIFHGFLIGDFGIDFLRFFNKFLCFFLFK